MNIRSRRRRKRNFVNKTQNIIVNNKISEINIFKETKRAYSEKEYQKEILVSFDYNV